MIRLYGVGKGNSSWPRVTAGVKKGLSKHGMLTSFFEIEDVDDAQHQHLGEGHDAPVGLCIGQPLSANIMRGRGQHRERLLMIATNSTWLPEVVMDKACQWVTGFIGTSRWACEVIRGYARELPVYYYPHGVDSRFRLLDLPPPEDFRVLHLASTHLQRKGTRELIQGWGMAMRQGPLPESSRLLLIADGPRGLFNEEIYLASGGRVEIARSCELRGRMDLDVEAACRLYSEHMAVCQPSRAEGFGLVPLEASACGVPVIATGCAGHADHISSQPCGGVVLIPHGEDAPIDDGPGALAPTVRSEDVAEALCIAYERRKELREQARAAADGVAWRWRWSEVTRGFLDRHADELGIMCWNA